MELPDTENPASGMESVNQEEKEDQTPKKSHVNDYDQIEVMDEEAGESVSSVKTPKKRRVPDIPKKDIKFVF